MSVPGAPFGIDKSYRFGISDTGYIDTTNFLAVDGDTYYDAFDRLHPTVLSTFSFTLPAGKTSALITFRGIWCIGYPYVYDYRVLNIGWWEELSSSYTLTCTSVGKGSVSPASATFAPGDSLYVYATPDSGESFINWVIDGVEYTTRGVAPTAGSANIVAVATFTDSGKYNVTGSYTSLGANNCPLSPYANLGSGNVSIQPRAFIFANGSSISNGETVEVDSGESVMIAVNTESIYTRIVSMTVNGVEYAGPGTNYASRDVSVTADSDITVAVTVAADRFCYQAGGGGDPIDPFEDDDGGDDGDDDDDDYWNHEADAGRNNYRGCE
jgi:hypothetical protein